MTNRIEKLLALMKRADMTHVLIQKPNNMRYLTGYTGEDIDRLLASDIPYGDFFRRAPAQNPAREHIRGSICGVRIELIEDPLMQDIRRLDKLIDGLARGKPLDRLLPE